MCDCEGRERKPHRIESRKINVNGRLYNDIISAENPFSKGVFVSSLRFTFLGIHG